MSEFDFDDIKKRVKSCESVWKRELGLLIAEVERLRSFGKDDNCLDCGRRAHLKENDIMLCTPCHTRRIENEEQIKSLTKERDELQGKFKSSKWLSAERYSKICALEEKQIKLEAENVELKKREEDIKEDFKFQMDKLTEELTTFEKARLDIANRIRLAYENGSDDGYHSGLIGDGLMQAKGYTHLLRVTE